MGKSINAYLPGSGNIILNKTNFVGSGGEADVYHIDDKAIKIYRDNSRSIEEGKILELSNVGLENFLNPLKPIYHNKSQEIIGYSMKYISNTYPICRLFTKTFKDNSNISLQNIIDLIIKLQIIIEKIHQSKVIIVDLNELNILISKGRKKPYFIDTDSYQTQSYNATAIMDSIRDPNTFNSSFSELSDWYSFAIISFQLLIGIHPFKGKHPNYKQSEWQDRMKANISVFDKDVNIPSVCSDFSLIPSKYLDWYKRIFINNERLAPPNLDLTKISFSNIYKKPQFIISEGYFSINKFKSIKENINKVYKFSGINYFLSENLGNKQFIYKNDQKEKVVNDNSIIHLLPIINSNEPIYVYLNHNKINFDFENLNKLGLYFDQIMIKEGYLYTKLGENLTRVSFKKLENQTVIPIIKKYPISKNAQLFDGIIYQNLLGNKILTLIYNEMVFNIKVPELNCYRVVEAKCLKNIAVFIVEKKNKFHRVIIDFDLTKINNIKYSFRETKNIDYQGINFISLKNGIFLLLNDEDNYLEVFKDNNKIKKVSNPPISNFHKLFSFNNQVYFIMQNEVFKISMN